MTFEKFNELFKRKYPQGDVDLLLHSTLGDRYNRVSIKFKPNGKSYHYSGTYTHILNRVGINAITNADLNTIKDHIECLKRTNGKPNPISTTNHVRDNTEEIIKWETQLKEYETSYLRS